MSADGDQRAKEWRLPALPAPSRSQADAPSQELPYTLELWCFESVTAVICITVRAEWLSDNKREMPEEHNISSAEAMLTLDSDLAELERVQECVDTFCDSAALSEQIRYHLSLVLEELVVNTVRHGRCHSHDNAIHIKLRVSGDRVQIVFSDSGIPFNPLATPTPNLAEDVGRRPIGGLGIHLVRCLMPEIRYERRGGRNYLFLTKPIAPNTGSTQQQGGVHANRPGGCAR